MPVGQPRQALEPGVAEHLPLTAQHRARGRPRHLPQLRVQPRQQPDVQAPVTALERLRRRPAATVLDPARPTVPPDQTRQLRPRQTRHLRQIPPHQPLVRLAQAVIVQPHQRVPDQRVNPFAPGAGKVHRFAALHKGAHLLQRPHPLGL